jgi:hypothetical protein
MKKFKRIVYFSILLLLLAGFLPSSSLLAQVPPPPPPNGGPNYGHGQGGNQGAPAAPIGGGFVILLVLGTFYTGKKLIDSTSENPTQ